MRAIWSGEIAFGLVTVPVKLFSATRDLTPRFHMIHKVCGARVQTARRCPTCDRDVPWDEIEKGYEVARGKYARFSKEEMAAVEPEETKGVVEIVEFVEPTEVDLAYLEKSYWVGPGGRNARSFLLLRTILERTAKVALAKVAIRSRTRLALLRPRESFFSLDMLRFADELVTAKDLMLPVTKTPSEKELSLARTLVLQLAAPFDPEKHPDEYRARVTHIAEEKVKEHKISVDIPGGARATESEGNVIDLSDLLARSLEAQKPGPAKANRRKSVDHARTRAGGGRR